MIQSRSSSEATEITLNAHCLPFAVLQCLTTLRCIAATFSCGVRMVSEWCQSRVRIWCSSSRLQTADGRQQTQARSQQIADRRTLLSGMRRMVYRTDEQGRGERAERSAGPKEDGVNSRTTSCSCSVPSRMRSQ
jgi:hypothetical protein